MRARRRCGADDPVSKSPPASQVAAVRETFGDRHHLQLHLDLQPIAVHVGWVVLRPCQNVSPNPMLLAVDLRSIHHRRRKRPQATARRTLGPSRHKSRTVNVRTASKPMSIQGRPRLWAAARRMGHAVLKRMRAIGLCEMVVET